MKIIFWPRNWTIEDIRNNRDHLFIFGDNDLMAGKGGQSIIRDESNTAGIPAKKRPKNDNTSFYTDLEAWGNENKIKSAINKIIEKSINFSVLVLPISGIGTGLAKLREKAPKTFKILTREIDVMIKKLINIPEFVEITQDGYPARTAVNIAESDCTIIFAIDSNTPGEKLTAKIIKSQKKPSLVIKLNDKLDNLEEIKKNVAEFISNLNKKLIVNIAGNSINRFPKKIFADPAKHGISQDMINEFVTLALKDSREYIAKIQSGGQTGVDQAGIIAGIQLGIPTKVNAPKNWLFRDRNGNDIASREKFISRFTY